MINNNIFKTLTAASSDIMRDNVESIAVVYITKDGDVKTAYDKKGEASALDLLGGVEFLKTRIVHGYFTIPELGVDDDTE